MATITGTSTITGLNTITFGSVGDSYWANVSLLAINDNAADASTTFTDQSTTGHTLTTVGGAQYDTAQAPTGMTSSGLFDGTGDIVSADDSAEFDLAAGDFTLEGYVRFNTVSGNHALLTKRVNGTQFMWIAIFQLGTSLVWYATSNGSSWNLASAKAIGTVATGAWYHWALNRTGSDWTPYLNGTAGAGTLSSAATLSVDTNAVRIGSDSNLYGFNGWQASVRITKGVGRYPTDFTPPSLPMLTS